MSGLLEARGQLWVSSPLVLHHIFEAESLIGWSEFMVWARLTD